MLHRTIIRVHDETTTSTPTEEDTGDDDMSDKRMAKALQDAKDEGYEDGLEKGRLEVLDWLQEKYLDDDAPARGSKGAHAILQVAREAAEEFQRRVGAKQPQDHKKKAKKP